MTPSNEMDHNEMDRKMKQDTARDTLRDTAQDIALFRYGIVRQVSDKSLTKSKRGAIVRQLASESHQTLNGDMKTISRATIDRWIRMYRKGGFNALYPSIHIMEPKTPLSILELADTLRKEDPVRTAAHIAQLIKTTNGWAPSPRTLQRNFKAKGLTRSQLLKKVIAYGRFEANYQNELWVGDALHAPSINGRKVILFCYLDDYSRLVTGFKFTHTEDTLSGQYALRRGILSRGLPGTIYLDNGSPFVCKQLLRSLAVLGVKLVHSKPGRPEGRGKIERFFRTVRDQFLVEVAHSDISTIEMLDQYFQAWVEQVYHKRVHSETNYTPLSRFIDKDFKPNIPDLGIVREAFLFSETRLVTKLATVSLFGNDYEVDQALTSRKVDLVFDPFDLKDIDVNYLGKNFNKAVAHKVKRHCHPMVVKHLPEAPIPSGIDYLSLLDEKHRKDLKASIDYSSLDSTEVDKSGVDK